MASMAVAFLASLFGLDMTFREVADMIGQPPSLEVKKQLQGIDYKQNGTIITVEDHRIDVLPYVENCGVLESGHLCGVRFEIKIDGAKDQRLTYGAVGNAPSKKMALEEAVEEWWAAFAGPVIQSIADKKADFMESSYVAFPGATLMRGNPPGGWLDGTSKMHQKITSNIYSVIGESPGVKSIVIKMWANEKEGVSGECRVNTKISLEIIDSLRQLNWPSTTTSYMFKQVYILKHKTES